MFNARNLSRSDSSGEIIAEPAHLVHLIDLEVHAYVAEAVRIMMSYGSGRMSFVPLLWAGLRDWEASSAWTRGKVSHFARFLSPTRTHPRSI